MHTLSVCRTCPRGGTPETGLRQALRDRWAEAASPALQLLVVECVGACPMPHSVAFDAPGKWRLRLSGLTPDHADDLFVALRLYEESGDGNLALDALPPGLCGHVSARSPTFAYPSSLPPTGMSSPFKGGVAPPLNPVLRHQDA